MLPTAIGFLEDMRHRLVLALEIQRTCVIELFWHWRSNVFLIVTPTMISKRFVKLSIKGTIEYDRKYEVKMISITLCLLFIYLLERAWKGEMKYI